jgi:DNA-binding MarR family transcriptional regulator
MTSTSSARAEQAGAASAAAEPTAAEPTAAEPTAAEPGAAEPGAAEPALAAASAVRRGVIGIGRRLRSERGAGLTGLELSVLGHLYRRGATSPGDLAGLERVQPQSLTRTLTRLESNGFAGRTPDPADGRRSLLELTAAGHETLRAEMAQRDAWLAAAMAEQLTTTEIELLRLAGDMLDRLAGSPIAAPAPAAPHLAVGV